MTVRPELELSGTHAANEPALEGHWAAELSPAASWCKRERKEQSK